MGLSWDIKYDFHYRVEQLATKLIASCLNYIPLVIDIYLLATWDSIVPKAEDDAESAATVTSLSLRIQFEIKGCIP